MSELQIGEQEYAEILITDADGGLLVSITDKDVIEEKNCKVVCVPADKFFNKGVKEILAGVPQEIKTLEVDAEKKIFKLNGVDFGDGCDYFEISCTGGEGFKIRMELSKRIICANYGFDNALKEPPTVRIME